MHYLELYLRHTLTECCYRLWQQYSFIERKKVNSVCISPTWYAVRRLCDLMFPHYVATDSYTAVPSVRSIACDRSKWVEILHLPNTQYSETNYGNECNQLEYIADQPNLTDCKMHYSHNKLLLHTIHYTFDNLTTQRNIIRIAAPNITQNNPM